MGLVDHDHGVTCQQGVDESLPNEQPIGEEFDACRSRGDIFKADGVTNFFADFATKLFGDADCYCSRRDASRLIESAKAKCIWLQRTYLCDADELPLRAPTSTLEELWDLSRLSRASLSNDYRDSIFLNDV